MENYNLLQYTIIQSKQSTLQENSKVNRKPAEDDIVPEQAQNLIESSKINVVQDNADTITINGKTVGIYGCENVEELDDAAIIGGASSTNPIEMADNLPKLATTTYKNFTPEEISNIKQAIYNLHHNINPPTPTPIDPEPNPNPDDESENKQTFINSSYDSFCDAESMFTYLNRITNGEITKSTGISRKQLIKLTENETAEETNSGFFGTLNRIFNNVNFNTNDDDVLSFDEINNFIGEELGTDAFAYLNKVNAYTNEIQEQYMLLTPQEKLDFVIEKTVEYLDCAGLEKQKAALERLMSETDTSNTNYAAKRGQIVMIPIANTPDGLTVLGAYQSAAFKYTYTPNGTDPSQRYTGVSHAYDYDSNGIDRGITLNSKLLNNNWYELVNTLVHELTHAAAYLYYPNPTYTIDEENKISLVFNQEQQLGAIKDILVADGLYEFYCNNFANIVNNRAITIPTGVHQGESAYDRLMYMLECQWGEYAAYQVDADYMDSIAGDIFNSFGNYWGNNDIATSVLGAQEASTIHNHIDNGYNTAGLTIGQFAEFMGIEYSDVVDADHDGIISFGDYYWENGEKVDAYSKEAKPDWDWATYNKNRNWSWSA